LCFLCLFAANLSKDIKACSWVCYGLRGFQSRTRWNFRPHAKQLHDSGIRYQRSIRFLLEQIPGMDENGLI
jgi:hypothetical protein